MARSAAEVSQRGFERERKRVVILSRGGEVMGCTNSARQ